MPEPKEDQNQNKVSKLTALVNYEKGSIASKSIIDRKAASITIYAFDKFQEIVAHTLPYDAIFNVIEGVAEVKINAKSHIIKEGEIIIFPGNKPHAISAKSKFKALLITLKE